MTHTSRIERPVNSRAPATSFCRTLFSPTLFNRRNASKFILSLQFILERDLASPRSYLPEIPVYDEAGGTHLDKTTLSGSRGVGGVHHLGQRIRAKRQNQLFASDKHFTNNGVATGGVTLSLGVSQNGCRFSPAGTKLPIDCSQPRKNFQHRIILPILVSGLTPLFTQVSKSQYIISQYFFAVFSRP